MSDIDNLRAMLSSDEADDIYDALIDIGKLELHEFKSEVWEFLDCKDSDLQRAAIMVLGTYWQIPEFLQKVRQIVDGSSNYEVRVTALMNLIGYYENTKDRELLTELCGYVRSGTENLFIRIEALRGLYRVFGIKYDENNFNAIKRIQSYSDFEKLVPWKDVEMIESEIGLR